MLVRIVSANIRSSHKPTHSCSLDIAKNVQKKASPFVSSTGVFKK